MSTTVSDPSFGPLVVGNVNDDDAAVIDSLVEQAPEPPAPVVEPIDATPLITPPVPTRLLSVRQSVDPTWQSPTLLMPADNKRKSLSIRVESDTATDGVVIMSDVRNGAGLARLYPGTLLTLDHHTGGVRVMAVGAAAVNVNVWSVTE
jgi:hypothetical protein